MQDFIEFRYEEAEAAQELAELPLRDFLRRVKRELPLYSGKDGLLVEEMERRLRLICAEDLQRERLWKRPITEEEADRGAAVMEYVGEQLLAEVAKRKWPNTIEL